MQPKYASAFAQKGAKNLMDAGPAYLSGPDAFFPIRIEKYRVSLSCIYILNQAQRQDDLAPGRYAFFDKYGELPVIARQKAGSLAGDRAACCYSQNTSYLRSGGRCRFSHTFQRNPLTGDWFDAIIFPVVTECTRDFHGPLAQLVRASGS